MTTPQERFRSLLKASEFLYELTDPKLTKGVPKLIREQARRILRHYPFPVEIEELAKLDVRKLLIEDSLASIK